MTNRLGVYARAAWRQGQRSPTGPPLWPDQAQQQITRGVRRIETFVQQHPITGISAVFCIGVVLGWFIKRS
jgi:ElaB/YqjD/DUF883 family membrane-anchored ribosome-binding protein